jgi:hypothetical protein
MSASTLIDATQRYHAVIVAPTGTFLSVPGYIAWLRSHYRAEGTPAGTLFVDRPRHHMRQ